MDGSRSCLPNRTDRARCARSFFFAKCSATRGRVSCQTRAQVAFGKVLNKYWPAGDRGLGRPRATVGRLTRAFLQLVAMLARRRPRSDVCPNAPRCPPPAHRHGHRSRLARRGHRRIRAPPERPPRLALRRAHGTARGLVPRNLRPREARTRPAAARSAADPGQKRARPGCRVGRAGAAAAPDGADDRAGGTRTGPVCEFSPMSVVIRPRVFSTQKKKCVHQFCNS